MDKSKKLIPIINR